MDVSNRIQYNQINTQRPKELYPFFRNVLAIFLYIYTSSAIGRTFWTVNSLHYKHSMYFLNIQIWIIKNTVLSWTFMKQSFAVL